MKLNKYIDKFLSYFSYISFVLVFLGTFGTLYVALPLALKINLQGYSKPIVDLVKFFIKDTLHLFLYSAGGFFIGNLTFFIEKVRANGKIRKMENKNSSYYNRIEELEINSSAMELDCEKLFSHILHGSFEALNLTKTFRVSLYYLEDKNFICLSRFSKNQKHKEKPNRLYKRDQGCIGSAWENGFCITENLIDPNNNFGKYLIQVESKLNLPRNISENIKMKSRALLGIGIKDPATDENIGVVVIETTNRYLSSNKNKDTILVAKIRKYFENGENIKLFNLIKELEYHFPKLDSSSNKGL